MKHFSAILIAQIHKLRTEGLTHREIAMEVGLEKKQIKKFFERQNKKKRLEKEISVPKRKGRPRKSPLTTQHGLELRIKELEREIELYKSFLHVAGRM